MCRCLIGASSDALYHRWSPAAYAAAYPTVMAGITEYFQSGHTADDLFRDCLEQIVHGRAAGG